MSLLCALRYHGHMTSKQQQTAGLPEKIAHEKHTLEFMVGIYCRGNKHGQHAEAGAATDGRGLCPECQELVDYSFARIDACPHIETKTFCSACETHCYKPDMRERVRKAMAYAGPRMIFHDPRGAFAHLRSRLGSSGRTN